MWIVFAYWLFPNTPDRDSLPDRSAGMMTADSSVCGCRKTWFVPVCRRTKESSSLTNELTPSCLYAMGLRQTRCSEGRNPPPSLPPCPFRENTTYASSRTLCISQTETGWFLQAAFSQWETFGVWASILLFHTPAFCRTIGHACADAPCYKKKHV